MKSHLFPRQFFFNIPQDRHCHFEPKPRSFEALLEDAACKMELAFDMFER